MSLVERDNLSSYDHYKDIVCGDYALITHGVWFF